MLESPNDLICALISDGFNPAGFASKLSIWPIFLQVRRLILLLAFDDPRDRFITCPPVSATTRSSCHWWPSFPGPANRSNWTTFSFPSWTFCCVYLARVSRYPVGGAFACTSCMFGWMESVSSCDECPGAGANRYLLSRTLFHEHDWSSGPVLLHAMLDSGACDSTHVRYHVADPRHPLQGTYVRRSFTWDPRSVARPRTHSELVDLGVELSRLQAGADPMYEVRKRGTGVRGTTCLSFLPWVDLTDGVLLDLAHAIKVVMVRVFKLLTKATPEELGEAARWESGT
jgi:hypothetical protein